MVLFSSYKGLVPRGTDGARNKKLGTFSSGSRLHTILCHIISWRKVRVNEKTKHRPNNRTPFYGMCFPQLAKGCTDWALTILRISK